MNEYWICKKEKIKEPKILGKGIKKRTLFIPIIKIGLGDKIELVNDGKGHKWSDYKLFVDRK